MNKTYLINLNVESDELEDYELEDKNLGEVMVYTQGDSSPAKGKGYCVSLSFSPDAMIGFGKELIRLGILAKEGKLDYKTKHEHLYPIYNDSATRQMGLYLTPDSAELMVFLHDFGKVEDVLEKFKKNNEPN